MVLTDGKILKNLKSGNIVIDPVVESQMHKNF